MDTSDELFCHRCGASFPAASTQFCPHDGVKIFPASVAARVGQQIDNYNLVDILDAGAMAVAIKILKDSFAEREAAAERFLREALAISRLEHPNIVDVTDCSTAPDGTPYFVMELLQGETLELALDRATVLPLFRTVNIVRQISSALVVAHAGGVVHRDLKPANIFLSSREGHRRLLRMADDQLSTEREPAFDFVKVIDFGVAKDLDAASVHSTQAGLVLGTPAYMAPEQINGAGIDARTDIYALGAMFYELVTGEVPFGGETMLEVLNGHVYGTVTPPAKRNAKADVNGRTSEVILRCLEKDPARRYQSADALCEALVGCFTDRAQVRDVVKMLARREQQDLQPGGEPRPRGRLTDELAELFGKKPAAAATTLPADAAATVEEPVRRRRSLTEELTELFGKKPAGLAE